MALAWPTSSSPALRATASTLLLRALLASLLCRSCDALTPSSVLAEWRSARVSSLNLDASRFHFQVLFVDDDNQRARIAECLTEQLAAWGDAGWWIYPHAATINATALEAGVDARLAAVLTSCGFDAARANADGAALDASDLSAYDLIVCADGATRAAVLELAEDEACEQSVRELGDFATVAADDSRVLLLGLDDEALGARSRERLARDEVSRYAAADAGRDREAFDALLETTAVCSASRVRYLMGTFDAAFVEKFNELLRAHFYDARHVGVEWREADEVLRRHVVTGALDPRERERLFEAHMAQLRRDVPASS